MNGRTLYSVSQKGIPNIFDCNLKKDDQILIASDTCLDWPLNVLTSPGSAETVLVRWEVEWLFALYRVCQK